MTQTNERGTGGLIRPDVEDAYWRESWRTRPYYRDDYTYDDYAPAYRAGWQAYERHGAGGKSFDEVEADLRAEYESGRGSSRLGWDQARFAVRDAWDRVKQSLGMAVQREPRAGAWVPNDGGLYGDRHEGGFEGGLGSTAAPTDVGLATTGVGSAGGTVMSGGSIGGASPLKTYDEPVTADDVDRDDEDDDAMINMDALDESSGTTHGGTGSGSGFNYGYGGASIDQRRSMGLGDGDPVSYLNSFLRGEISAVETYRQAIMRLGTTYPQLGDCLRSHERRVGLLQDRIRALGGEPATGSGMWGAWAKLVQGGANLFGERPAIAALEAGEDHGRDDYRRELDHLDAETRAWVERELLSEEERTHAVLSELKHAHV